MVLYGCWKRKAESRSCSCWFIYARLEGMERCRRQLSRNHAHTFLPLGLHVPLGYCMFRSNYCSRSLRYSRYSSIRTESRHGQLYRLDECLKKLLKSTAEVTLSEGVEDRRKQNKLTYHFGYGLSQWGAILAKHIVWYSLATIAFGHCPSKTVAYLFPTICAENKGTSGALPHVVRTICTAGFLYLSKAVG